VQDVEISLHRHEQYDGLQGFLSVAGKCSVDSQEIADLRRPGHRVIDLASIGFGADAVTSRAAESPGLCMLSARSGALIDTPVTVPQFAKRGPAAQRCRPVGRARLAAPWSEIATSAMSPKERREGGQRGDECDRPAPTSYYLSNGPGLGPATNMPGSRRVMSRLSSSKRWDVHPW
jgi:hypothetical protein